jgi:hypothetical protein
VCDFLRDRQREEQRGEKGETEREKSEPAGGGILQEGGEDVLVGLCEWQNKFRD